ncbi:MAG: RluA family pseudouridine synthase [bacterium]|nr:RluA family pseudouridine synthase [bacterium]
MTKPLNLPNNLSGQRLDAALAQHTGQSRSHWQRQLKQGLVADVTGKPLKAHQLYTNNLTLVISPEPATAVVLVPINLNIMYEDEAIIVLNKPSGQIVHPGVGQTSESIAEALIRHYPAIVAARYTDSALSYDRAGIVHRLDKDTSGVLLVAKTHAALLNLQSQFKERTIKKDYRALVLDDCESQTVDQPIGRHPKYRRKQSVTHHESAREAITQITALKVGLINGHTVSYLKCEPLTGRMHQLRVHLQFINHCILGDVLYNTKRSRRATTDLKVSRLLLHAYQISFVHPNTNHKMTFVAPIPRDLSTYKGMI